MKYKLSTLISNKQLHCNGCIAKLNSNHTINICSKKTCNTDIDCIIRSLQLPITKCKTHTVLYRFDLELGFDDSCGRLELTINNKFILTVNKQGITTIYISVPTSCTQVDIHISFIGTKQLNIDDISYVNVDTPPSHIVNCYPRVVDNIMKLQLHNRYYNIDVDMLRLISLIYTKDIIELTRCGSLVGQNTFNEFKVFPIIDTRVNPMVEIFRVTPLFESAKEQVSHVFNVIAQKMINDESTQLNSHAVLLQQMCEHISNNTTSVDITSHIYDIEHERRKILDSLPETKTIISTGDSGNLHASGDDIITSDQLAVFIYHQMLLTI